MYIIIYFFYHILAKSKIRNKKKHKRKGKAVASAPLFPAIIELVAEENKERKEIELQPESPLTAIYCTISRKTPVMWPAFLGDWAYSNDDILQKCTYIRTCQYNWAVFVFLIFMFYPVFDYVAFSNFLFKFNCILFLIAFSFVYNITQTSICVVC